MDKSKSGNKQVLAGSNHEHNDQIANFSLERYKYILEEIRSLNENIHKYLALFQTLATAIIGGGIGVFVGWKNLNIGASIARAAIQGVLGLLLLLALFIIISIVVNVFSWFDYRKEEVELLDKIIGSGFRKHPSLYNFWRWSETYVILFIIVTVLLVFFYIEYQIIPLIN